MHRLVVVDENDVVIGIISLSDLLLYLVLKPSGDDGAPGILVDTSKDQEVLPPSSDSSNIASGQKLDENTSTGNWF